MVAVKIGLAISAKNEQALEFLGAHEMPHQQEAGSVRPMQVIENEQHRYPGTRHGEKSHDRVKKAELFRLRVRIDRARHVGETFAHVRQQRTDIRPVSVGPGVEFVQSGVDELSRASAKGR